VCWWAMDTTGRSRTERRLAAILAADIAGDSRLIGADEEGTLGRMCSLRTEGIDPAVAGHRGRLVQTTRAGLLVEFSSVIDALRGAVQMQQAIADRIANLPKTERLEYRIGIHQGDVVVEDGDIFGDGVISPPALKVWPTRVASACRRECRRTSPVGSISPLRTSAHRR